MAFTDSQKSHFIAALQAQGWEMRNATIYSPSGKIDFGEAHFENSEPEQMRTTFLRRAGIIESAALEDWKRTATSADKYLQRRSMRSLGTTHNPPHALDGDSVRVKYWPPLARRQ